MRWLRLRIGAWMFQEGKYITQYDHHIAGKLAYVMCGGELTRRPVGERAIYSGS